LSVECRPRSARLTFLRSLDPAEALGLLGLKPPAGGIEKDYWDRWSQDGTLFALAAEQGLRVMTVAAQQHHTLGVAPHGGVTAHQHHGGVETLRDPDVVLAAPGAGRVRPPSAILRRSCSPAANHQTSITSFVDLERDCIKSGF
jgi:hypothetical protein